MHTSQIRSLAAKRAFFARYASSVLPYLGVSLALVAMLAFSTAAIAGTVSGTPTFTVTVDSDSTPVTGWTWNSVDEQWEIDGWSWTSPGGDDVNVSGAFVPDPSLVYTFGVTDFGAPSTFTFAMTMPIAPTGPLTEVQASISGGLTDFSGNGITLTPNPAQGDPDGDGPVETQVARVGPGAVPTVDMGVDVGLAETHGPGLAGAVYTYGPYGAGPQAGPVGIWNSMGVVTSFSLTGGNDAASLTGFARIDTVPEPSSLALLCCAAGALLAVYGVKRR